MYSILIKYIVRILYLQKKEYDSTGFCENKKMEVYFLGRMEEYLMVHAEKLEDMLKVFKPFPLGEKNYDQFYVETSEARGQMLHFE